MTNELVMYLIVRESLHMSPGKTAAQVGHAVADLIHDVPNNYRDIVDEWFSQSQAKIVLKASDEEFEKLIEAFDLGETVTTSQGNLFIDHCVVIDEGRTEIPTGLKTAIGLLPIPKKEAHKFLGHLKLL